MALPIMAIIVALNMGQITYNVNTYDFLKLSMTLLINDFTYKWL